jgi:hypothetical protein
MNFSPIETALILSCVFMLGAAMTCGSLINLMSRPSIAIASSGLAGVAMMVAPMLIATSYIVEFLK